MNGKLIKAHKCVLLSESQLFKKQLLWYSIHLLHTDKYELPKELDKKIFKLVLRYIYLGEDAKFAEQLAKTEFAMRVLQVALFLGIGSLKKHLLVHYLLPKITPESCLQFVKVASQNHVLESDAACKSLWNMLLNQSVDFFARNSAGLLQSELTRQEFLRLPPDLVIRMVKESLARGATEAEVRGLLQVLVDRRIGDNIIDILFHRACAVEGFALIDHADMVDFADVSRLDPHKCYMCEIEQI